MRLPLLVRMLPFAVAWVLTLGVTAVHAQLRMSHAVERLAAEQPANLFASWEGRVQIDGFEVELPEGWSLQAAYVLPGDYGAKALSVRSVREGATVYRLVAPAALKGPCELMLHVESGTGFGRATWRIVPVVRGRDGSGRRWEALQSFQGEGELLLESPPRPSGNLMLSFEGAVGPVLLRQAGLPDLGTTAPHTIAFWLQTTGLGEVVLSTWDGDEARAYPFEFVVDARGRLRFYRGRPGQHQSMTAQPPVADGRWHHVALVNDPARGWAHLYLDGTAVDSLSSIVPFQVELQGPVALGGRLVLPRDSTKAGNAFEGALDEVQFWPSAHNSLAVRRGMQLPLREQPEGGVVLGFEAPLPDVLRMPESVPALRVPGSLAFFHPIDDLRVVVEAGVVRLRWATHDHQTRAFVVERSYDGRRFDAIRHLPVAEAADPTGDGPGRFRFEDEGVAGRVVYYRLRQVFAGGAERLSGTVKLGLGDRVPAADLPSAVADIRLGNFPNPFNATTTVTYSLGAQRHVRLSVWDLSGQQVAVLVDDEKAAGSYEVPFEAGDLPSGPYFVRLQTEEEVLSSKMTLMK